MDHTADGAAFSAASEPTALHKIPDRKPVRVYLPLKNSRQRYRTQAVYRPVSEALFKLRFRPGTLPLEHLDRAGDCLVNVDFGGPNVSLTAAIVGVSEATLELQAETVISHEQMREFFRVDAVTDVISRSFQPAFYHQDGQSWALQGKTIDISGNGILASFTQRPPDEAVVRLELTLPDQRSEIIRLLARTVRSNRIDEHQWDVAFHFQDISMEDRDRIIGCCLEIQRRLLRLRVDPVAGE